MGWCSSAGPKVWTAAWGSFWARSTWDGKGRAANAPDKSFVLRTDSTPGLLTCCPARSCWRGGFWACSCRGPSPEASSLVSAEELRAGHFLKSWTLKHVWWFILVCRWHHSFKCFSIRFFKWFVIETGISPSAICSEQNHERPELWCSWLVLIPV